MNAAVRGQPVQPYDQQDPVNAGDTSTVSFTWLNSDQEPEAPASLRYRIDNLSDYQNVLTWTAISPPLAATEITITPSQNAMTYQWRDRQLMQVTAEATMDSGAVRKKLFVYELIAQIQP